MNYGEILGTALRLSWRNRYLWFFGFFAGSGFNVPTPGGSFDPQMLEGGGARFPEAVAAVDGGLVAAIIAVAVAVFLLFLALSVLAQGGLAESIAALDRGEARDFRSTWRAGATRFWPMLRLVLLLVLLGFAGVVAIGIPVAAAILGVLAATEEEAARLIVIITAAIVGICALIVLGAVLGVVGQFAVRQLALTGGRARAAIGFGWRLFRGRLGPALVLLLISIGIGIGVAIALTVAILLVGLVLFIPTIALAISGAEVAAIVTGVVAGLVLLAAILVAAGALGTFQHAYWTLAYLRLTAAPAGPAA